jgi:hypothetical protein
MDTLQVRPNQLFLDLDGVLADFDRTAREIVGMDSYKFEFLHGGNEFWRRMNEVDDLFNTFHPMPDAFELWDAVKHLNPFILTALPHTNADVVDAQKRRWVRRHLGSSVPVFTCETSDKPLYCSPGDVLVDDRTVNRTAWRRRGGRFVQHTSARESLDQLRSLGILSNHEATYA